MSGVGIVSDVSFGYIDITLKSVLESKGMNRFQLSNKTGIKFDIITKYYFNECIQIDLTNLAKICCVLDCDASDIVKYHKIREKQVLSMND